MSKECVRSLRKGCGGHAAGPAAHIDEHPVVDSRSERMLMGLLRDGPILGSGASPAIRKSHRNFRIADNTITIAIRYGVAHV
jgi:hypothetical protein